MNYHRPRFNSSHYEVEVSEATKPSTILLTLSAADEDGLTPLVYELVNMYRVSEPAHFYLEQTKGDLVLGTALDR